MSRIGNRISSARRIIAKLVFLFVALALIASFGVAPAMAQATTFIENVRMPIEILVFVPCAAGGAGEYVQLSGTLHSLLVTTIDDTGGFVSKYHFQPQGISGTGETTGDLYHGTGVTQGTFTGRLGFEATDINNFRIIGQGSGNNFLIHQNFHITVLPDGSVTAFVDRFSVQCR